MAITKILTINDCGEKFAGKHLKQAIEYITDSEKTQKGRFVAGINCQPQDAFVQMKATKHKFGKTDKRQGYHIILSFEEEDVKPELAFEIVGRFVEEYLGEEYEAVYAVHDNTVHPHGHVIFNSVNFLTGRKYCYEKGDWAKVIQPITNRLCKEYGLSTIEIEMEPERKEEEKTKRNEYYKDWNDFRDGKFIWRDMIKRDLDACIMQAFSFEKFLDLLREKGYVIKQNKYLAVKPPGMQRFCRCKSLGADYTEEIIRQRIVAETISTYGKRNREGNSDHMKKVENEFLRRTKLTGIQKTYYAKVCRIRQIAKLPYSKAWQYREEIRKMEEVHDRYLFLVKNEIHSVVELVGVKCNLEKKAKECQKERRELYREKKRFEPLFAITDKMKELQPAEDSFRAGDTFFEKEHRVYQELAEQLSEEGYALKEVEVIRQRCQDKIAGNYEKRKAVNQRLKIAEELLAEFSKAVTRTREQEEQNKEIKRKGKQPKR